MSDQAFKIVHRRRSMKSSLKIISPAMIFIMLTACSELNPQGLNIKQDQQSASSGDHRALAQHYEKRATEMQAKADEYKHHLESARAKSYLYGRQRETFEKRSRMLIKAYENAVAESRAMAEAQYRIR